MSDEASGPEDDDETSKAMWRTKMIFKGSYGEVTPDAVAKLSFIEVLAADWRCDEVHCTNWLQSPLTPRPHERGKIPTISVYATPVAHHDLAPYNFGINRTWFDKHKKHPEYRSLLVDWDKYADPAGLGTNRMQAGEDEPVVEAPQLNREDDSEADAARSEEK
ncbi:hypothetical protein C8R44DRAFT_882542 [Mycena epipterygia]|nr:hypothetical protein C8R44DRAFT_882542 [Mycena epipterygia]